MEIPRQQFQKKLSIVEEAIKECDVLAIDTELSGLHRPPNPVRLYSMDDRYIEYKEATERFIIVQFGLATFKWDEPSGRYISKAFNFYIFPTSSKARTQSNRVFSTQAQAFDFLVEQSFDFNKWVYQGISYMTKEEERAFVTEAEKKLKGEMPDILVDAKEMGFMEDARKKIKECFSSKKGVNIITKNGYQRRLIYQETRKFEGLTATGGHDFIRVQNLSKEEEKKRQKENLERFEEDCANAIGFTQVINMISKSGKMLVGHNMLLDICHVIGQFVQPLPATLAEFKLLANSVFPNMIDTKFMCASEPQLKSIFNGGTALESVRFETSREAFQNPRIDMHAAYPRYMTEMAHEAGYDAFITGSVFLKLASFLDKAKNPEKFIKSEEEKVEEEPKPKNVDADGWDISDDEEENKNSGWNMDEEEEVYNYGTIRVNVFKEDKTIDNVLEKFNNKSAIVRTAFDYFDFMGPELITDQPNAFYISYQPEVNFTKEKASDIFSRYGKHIVEENDAKSSFVIFENLKEDLSSLVAGFEEFKIMPISKYIESLN